VDGFGSGTLIVVHGVRVRRGWLMIGIQGCECFN
jgi:hypothetical protein